MEISPRGLALLMPQSDWTKLSVLPAGKMKYVYSELA